MAAVNGLALPIYLWHQAGLIVVTVAVAWLAGGQPVDGLHTAPDAGWLALRATGVGVSAVLLVVAVRGARAPAAQANARSTYGGDRCAR